MSYFQARMSKLQSSNTDPESSKTAPATPVSPPPTSSSTVASAPVDAKPVSPAPVMTPAEPLIPTPPGGQCYQVPGYNMYQLPGQYPAAMSPYLPPETPSSSHAKNQYLTLPPPPPPPSSGYPDQWQYMTPGVTPGLNPGPGLLYTPVMPQHMWPQPQLYIQPPQQQQQQQPTQKRKLDPASSVASYPHVDSQTKRQKLCGGT